MDVRYEGENHSDGSEEPDLILTDDESLIADSNTGNNERVAHMGMLSVLEAVYGKRVWSSTTTLR